MFGALTLNERSALTAQLRRAVHESMAERDMLTGFRLARAVYGVDADTYRAIIDDTQAVIDDVLGVSRGC